MDIQEEMVKRFQCHGCVCGNSPEDCEKYELHETGGSEFTCISHVCGTFGFVTGHILPGLPKGFDRIGYGGYVQREERITHVRLYTNPPGWDHLNVPVWAMEQDGYLFVRTFVPRLSVFFVDVIKDGTLALVPNAINVKNFIDEID